MQENTTVDPSPERIRRMFDGIAPWYDFLNHFLSLGIDRRWRRRTAARLLNADTPPGPILDVCCGTGDLTLAFMRRLRKLAGQKLAGKSGRVERKLYGIDFSPEMIVRAGKKSRRFAKQNEIEFLPGNALEIPFESETFAVVCVAFGLRNVGETDRGIAEMVRVCKPGGTVGVLEFSLPKNPLISGPYRFYFESVLPRLGQFFSKSDEEAYRYLPQSVLRFDDTASLLDRMRRHGLVDLRAEPMTFGIATLHWGTRNEKSDAFASL